AKGSRSARRVTVTQTFLRSFYPTMTAPTSTRSATITEAAWTGTYFGIIIHPLDTVMVLPSYADKEGLDMIFEKATNIELVSLCATGEEAIQQAVFLATGKLTSRTWKRTMELG
ncbi:hypothetical protein ACFLXD_04305, partial [Chloroflexota bacterium]